MRLMPGHEVQGVKYIMDKIKGSWITVILNPNTTHPHHTVIVVKVVGDIVHIRYPWDKDIGFGADWGVEATMKIEDFAFYWEKRGSSFIYVSK